MSVVLASILDHMVDIHTRSLHVLDAAFVAVQAQLQAETVARAEAEAACRQAMDTAALTTTQAAMAVSNAQAAQRLRCCMFGAK